MPLAQANSSYALSIKQPWAALVVAGLKTIEVRTWATTIRGRIFIHAGKLVDKRPVGWDLITDSPLKELSELRGGIIGTAELFACKAYRNVKTFVDEQPLHHNLPEWFRPPVLYGFEFRQPRPIPFTPCPGNTFFFKVQGVELS